MRATLPLLAAAVLLASCGSDPESTPLACLEGPEAYLQALDGDSDPPALEGGIEIRECLIPDQPAGDLNVVGSAAVGAATELNAQVRRAPQPDDRAASNLGYLVGSVEQGASETSGIHADLVRRINSAARFSESGRGLGAEFERSFGASYIAARDAG